MFKPVSRSQSKEESLEPYWRWKWHLRGGWDAMTRVAFWKEGTRDVGRAGRRLLGRTEGPREVLEENKDARWIQVGFGIGDDQVLRYYNL